MIRIAALLMLAAIDTWDAAWDESGRIAGLTDSPSERLNPPRQIAPGAPPVLSFRYFDATDRGRFGNMGLMTDDAGH